MPKVAIFHTDHANDWCTSKHGTFAEMGVELLQRCGAGQDVVEYVVFDVYDGEVPPPAMFKSGGEYSGIYITGSRYDSFNTETAWINRLRSFLKEVLGNPTAFCAIVGVCFGHQIIAHALGCKVDRNPNGCEDGVVPVALNEIGQRLFAHKQQINLSQLHNDAVLQVPTGYAVWGSTEVTPVQGFYDNKHRKLLTFQGHPEFSTQVAVLGIQHKKPAYKNNTALYNKRLQDTTTLPNDGPVAARAICSLFNVSWREKPSPAH